MCCSPWGHRESDTAQQLNQTEIYTLQHIHGHSNISFYVMETMFLKLKYSRLIRK